MVYFRLPVDPNFGKYRLIRFQNTKFGSIFFDANSISTLFLTESTYSLILSTYRADVIKTSTDNDNMNFNVKLYNLDNSYLGEFTFVYIPAKKLVIWRVDNFVVKFRIGSDDPIDLNDVEINYDFPTMKTKPKESSQSDKFGTLDFETYTDSLVIL
jgi:hypothetical protein